MVLFVGDLEPHEACLGVADMGSGFCLGLGVSCPSSIGADNNP